MLAQTIVCGNSGRGDALLIPTRKKTFTAHKRRFPFFSVEKKCEKSRFSTGTTTKKSCEAFSYSNRPFLSSFRFPCFDIPAKGGKEGKLYFFCSFLKGKPLAFVDANLKFCTKRHSVNFFAQERRVGKTT